MDPNRGGCAILAETSLGPSMGAGRVEADPRHPLSSYLSMRSSFSFRRCSLLFKMLIHCAGSNVGSGEAKAAGWWQMAPF